MRCGRTIEPLKENFLEAGKRKLREIDAQWVGGVMSSPGIRRTEALNYKRQPTVIPINPKIDWGAALCARAQGRSAK